MSLHKYKLQTSIAIISSSIRDVLEAFQLHSVKYVSEGLETFRLFGRGAYVVNFKNVNALLNSTMFIPVFYPLDMLKRMKFTVCTDMCTSYDPNNSVLFMVTVNISKKLSKMGKDSSLGTGRIFLSDSYKDVKPVYDDNGIIVPPASMQVANVEDINKLQRLQCFVCHQPTHHQTCARCKLVNYCGESCQRKHWSEHKLKCKKMAGIRTKIRKAVILGPEFLEKCQKTSELG